MSDNRSSAGVGAPMILFFIFLTLKLTGHIDWSWWWVLAPLWIVASLCLLIAAFCLVMYMVTK